MLEAGGMLARGHFGSSKLQSKFRSSVSSKRALTFHRANSSSRACTVARALAVKTLTTALRILSSAAFSQRDSAVQRSCLHETLRQRRRAAGDHPTVAGRRDRRRWWE